MQLTKLKCVYTTSCSSCPSAPLIPSQQGFDLLTCLSVAMRVVFWTDYRVASNPGWDFALKRKTSDRLSGQSDWWDSRSIMRMKDGSGGGGHWAVQDLGLLSGNLIIHPLFHPFCSFSPFSRGTNTEVPLISQCQHIYLSAFSSVDILWKDSQSTPNPLQQPLHNFI